MNKIIAIGIISVMVTMVVASIFIGTLPSKNEVAPIAASVPLDTSSYQKDEAALSSIGSDLALLSNDENLSVEFNQIFNDILDVNESALDEESISKEAASMDYSDDLNSLVKNDAALDEAGQAFTDIAQ